MTNDELLAGFLDRSLSEDELLEFETRQQNNPAFAEEVQRMVTTEELLQGSAPTVKYPVGFLANIESSVAARILAAGTAATVGAVATKGLWANVWTWVTAGVGAVAIGTGAFWYANQQNEKPQQPVQNSGKQQTTTIQTQQAIQQPAPAVQQPPTNQPNTQVRVQPGGGGQPGNIGLENPPDAIAHLKHQLELCKQAADKNLCGHINRALGNELRKRGQYDEAKTYLEASLLYAQQSGIRQFEMDAIGELGLLAQAQGNTQLATEKFNAAIAFGKTHNLDATKWKKALDK